MNLHSTERGYAMAALLVAMSVMAVVMSVALPVWNTTARREREEELIFRGQQYARAITLFQRRYAGAFPPSIDVLVNEKFLRKRYLDPITGEEFQIIPVGAPIPGQTTPPAQGGRGGVGTPIGQQLGRGAGAPLQPAGGRGGGPQIGAQTGIQGVVSSSEQQSLRLYNGRDRYNEWAFVATAATTQGGVGGEGGQTPGLPGRGGAPAPGPGGRGIQQPGRGVQPIPGRGAQPGGRGNQPVFPQQPGGRRGF